MGKGQMKGNKEAKKPKADKDKPKASESAYQKSQHGDIDISKPFAKKS
jgi:hypothetical protein